jgi:peptide deformylase
MKILELLKNYKLQGKFLEIVTYPSPVLSKIAQPVTEFNESLQELCLDMLYTMYHAPGIGLAAPQVGKSLRVFVIDIDYEREEVTLSDGSTDYRHSEFNPKIFINPKFIKKTGEKLYEEGCLSLPGIYEEVMRSESVSIEYQDVYGNNQILEAKDLLAICLQHENDHLDGIVFIDHLSLLKKNFFKNKLTKDKSKRKL